jgi:DNA topoisomerase-1
LRYVSTAPLPPGIRRLRQGKGFRYVSPEGKALRSKSELERVRALAIPPAWTDVWICPSSLGHIQAMGRDARGRKQYRYHAWWRDVRDETKYGLLVAFGKKLPAIRRRVRADLRRSGLPREKVIAVVVQLLERTMMRIGNEEYARTNQSFGLTTLRDRHVTYRGGAVEFKFRGKSGKDHHVRVADPRLVRIVKACQDIPGYELFQYLDEDGQRQGIDSADVNDYLREISGAEMTAKVFRTWAGTVRAVAALRELKPVDAEETTKTETSQTLVEIVKIVAGHLGNTPAVCRKCYIHPAVIESFEKGEFHERLARLGQRKSRAAGLDADERLTLAFLADAMKPRAKRRRRSAVT